MGVLMVIACATPLVLVAVALLIVWDVCTKRVHTRQTLREAFGLYTSLMTLIFMGKLYRGKLLQATKEVARAQKSFLLDQLLENTDTEYGEVNGFEMVESVEDFQRMHPLTRYDHYAPYVERMMDGEKKILTRKQPELFGVSSGTSGGSKIIPMLKKQQSLFFKHAVSVFYCSMVEAYPQITRRLKKSLKIFYNPDWRTSKSGIKIGPNSSTPSSLKNILHMYTTPVAAFHIQSEPNALYVHLLFAMKDRHVGAIEGNFASLVYNAMCTMHSSLPQLLRDIRQGTLNPSLKIQAGVRKELEKLLKPDPARAEEIQQAFQEGLTGVARRMWPELDVVLTVDSGSFIPYADKLRETFCQGVPLYSAVYSATEGLMAVNLWPDQQPSRYLAHPAVQFLEFIPVDNSHQDQPVTLLLHQLKEGKEYEMVLTNVSGLYRYRLGDVVKVTGFYNQCPVLEFKYRIGQFLNVRGEKISELLFYQNLSHTVAQWSDFTLVDYCCAESVLLDDIHMDTEGERGAPCYHLFLEVQGKDGHLWPSEDQKQMIDERLCAKSYVYSSFRNKGSIDVMRVHLLRHGAFRDFRQHVIEHTDASSNQFKVPRVLKRKSLVEFLMTRRI